LKVDEDFYRELRRYALEHDRTVTEIAVEALKEWWEGRATSPPA
jgi:hypothetical protein